VLFRSPDARYKVFLTASAEEREERRYKQLKEKGVSVTLAGLLREILARDARDASRAVAPLRPAEDAVRIDTTGLPIDAGVEQVLALVGSSRPMPVVVDPSNPSIHPNPWQLQARTRQLRKT